MKKILFAMCLIGFMSCGFESVNNEAVGQIKKIHKYTPLVCPNYYTVDVSLGVMMNGTGSISKEDVELVVTEKELQSLKQLTENGKLVKVTYDVKRVTFCNPNTFLTTVSEVGTNPSAIELSK